MQLHAVTCLSMLFTPCKLSSSQDLVLGLVLDGKLNPKVSNHPVHILDREGNISPSSFIPFCAFGDNKKSMGRQVNGFRDPVCDSFQAKVRNGQLCYEVDLQKNKDEYKIQKQLKSGLILLFDYNVERQSKMYNPKKIQKDNSDENENDIHIYLDTISKLKMN